jgi:hypothetical protein
MRYCDAAARVACPIGVEEWGNKEIGPADEGTKVLKYGTAQSEDNILWQIILKIYGPGFKNRDDIFILCWDFVLVDGGNTTVHGLRLIYGPISWSDCS